MRLQEPQKQHGTDCLFCMNPSEAPGHIKTVKYAVREQMVDSIINRVIVGDALEVLKTLPDSMVHCVITSPPYWGLRDYGVDGQLGTEKTVDQYISRLVEIFREVHRVMRDDATLWLNLGDTYHKKELTGVPWRVALALQAQGWMLRSDIIWHKPNAMPSSVKDRPTTTHEYIFLLTKSPNYYYDADSVRSPAYTGKTLRTVWTHTTKPFRGAHFATFPPDLILPCVLAGTSVIGCCGVCGTQYKAIVDRGVPDTAYQKACGGDSLGTYTKGATKNYHGAKAQDPAATKARILASLTKRKLSGWELPCACLPKYSPASIVLDPFIGSGTTGMVAYENYRSFIGIEINPQYAAEAERRILKTSPLVPYMEPENKVDDSFV